MTALRFQTGGRNQTSPASLRGSPNWQSNADPPCIFSWTWPCLCPDTVPFLWWGHFTFTTAGLQNTAGLQKTLQVYKRHCLPTKDTAGLQKTAWLQKTLLVYKEANHCQLIRVTITTVSHGPYLTDPICQPWSLPHRPYLHRPWSLPHRPYLHQPWSLPHITYLCQPWSLPHRPYLWLCQPWSLRHRPYLVLLTFLNCCMSTLHLVHYALLLTPTCWKSNNTNARLMVSTPSLALDLRHCSTLSSFKAKLKTFLFSQYFHPN